jgi:hypothetical protein
VSFIGVVLFIEGKTGQVPAEMPEMSLIDPQNGIVGVFL